MWRNRDAGLELDGNGDWSRPKQRSGRRRRTSWEAPDAERAARPTPPAPESRPAAPRTRPAVPATTGQLPVARTRATGAGPTGTAPIPVVGLAQQPERVVTADPRLRGTRTRRTPTDPAVRPFSDFAPSPVRLRTRRGARGLVSFFAVVALGVGMGLPALATGALSDSAHASASDADAQSMQVGNGVVAADASVDAVASALAAVVAPSWVRPVDATLGDPFGPRPVQPVPGVSLFHRGQDLVTDCGTSIHAAAAGTVVAAGWFGTYGNWILIDHGNGVSTGYAHEERVLVSIGQKVHEGQLIGLVGETGAATGCHLHLEVRLNGVAVNPVPFFAAKHAPLG